MKRLSMLTDPRVAALYSGVPPAELEELEAFLAAHPYRFLTLDGVEWGYIATEPRGDDLLLLSGALGAPEVSWKTLTALAKSFRVIAPEYPPVESMDALVDGIAAILRRENVARAHVLGGSYGGFVAQVFVRRHAALARSLVLSHTLPPNPASGKKLRKLVRWFALLPQGMLLWMMGRRLSGLLPKETPETAALHAITREMLRFRLTKADLLALLRRTVDFGTREFAPGDLEDWQGKTLLLLADDDPGTPAAVRAQLQALYPDAKLHLFHGSGHATAILRQEEYLAVVEEFLRTSALR